MNRRTALKHCLVFTAATAIVPACLQQKNKSSATLKNIQLNAGQEELIAQLSETIIPSNETPGAKDVGASGFALMMVDDCYSPAEQQQFMTGLQQFEDLSKKTYGKKFTALSSEQRLELLAALDAKKEDKNNAAAAFYKSVRGLTLQAFTGSQYYLTKVHVYEMVPGRYRGCVPVKSMKA